jgi:hypothetical protein
VEFVPPLSISAFPIYYPLFFLKVQIQISGKEPYAAVAVYSATQPALSASALPLTWQAGVAKTVAPVTLAYDLYSCSLQLRSCPCKLYN